MGFKFLKKKLDLLSFPNEGTTLEATGGAGDKNADLLKKI